MTPGRKFSTTASAWRTRSVPQTWAHTPWGGSTPWHSGRYPGEETWRIWVAMLILSVLSGLSGGVFGCGREALQLNGFAMRLFHLGMPVSVVGDMTMPPLGAGGY